MANDYKHLAASWFEEIWNKGRREAIREMLQPDAVIHEGSHVSTGPEGFEPFFDRMQNTFSGVRITINDLIGEGNKVVVRWTARMNHTGPGLGFAPTGKAAEATGMSVIRFAPDGKIAEAWQNWDMMAVVAQLQAAPAAPLYIAAADPDKRAQGAS